MSRVFGFLALMVTGLVAVTLLAGSLTGTMHEMALSAGGGTTTLSPMALGYGALGIMMGFAFANLMRFSWLEMPRLVLRWLRGQRRNFGMIALSGVFASVLLFY